MNAVLIVAATALAMMLVEWLRPGVVQPRVPWWIARVAAFNAAQVAVVWLGACSWDRWLPRWKLFDGESLGPTAGALLGYLAITFVFYWWHRARHEEISSIRGSVARE